MSDKVWGYAGVAVCILILGLSAASFACFVTSHHVDKPVPNPRWHDRQDEYEEGGRAFEAGISVDSNPYHGTVAVSKSSAWQNGWVDAKLESVKAKKGSQ